MVTTMMNKNIAGTYRQIAETAREVAYNVIDGKAEYDNSELSLLAYAYSKGHSEGFQEAIDIVKRNVIAGKEVSEYNIIDKWLDNIASVLSRTVSLCTMTKEQNEIYAETLSGILKNKGNSTLDSGKLDDVVVYTYNYGKKEGLDEFADDTDDALNMIDKMLTYSFVNIAGVCHFEFNEYLTQCDEDDPIITACKKEYNEDGDLFKGVTDCIDEEDGSYYWSVPVFSTTGHKYICKYYPLESDPDACGDPIPEIHPDQLIREYYDDVNKVKEAVLIRPQMPEVYERIYTDYRDVIYSPDTAD
jgi:hypothetical protein